MLILQGISYAHPNRELLFADINLIINKKDKIALIGNNGVGKSTLLNIVAGNLPTSHGFVNAGTKPYYVPQLFGQYNEYSVAQALQVEDKLSALQEVLHGNVTAENLALLNDDWDIEEQCSAALTHWRLDGVNLAQKMKTLSGGQKTKVFLAGIMIHQPELVLLDEPSNHLDLSGRNVLYDYIDTATNTVVVVSHDRTLLNFLNTVFELTKHGINVYGGNYDFYENQKMIETQAFYQVLKSKEKALRKAKETERESLERVQKLDARGKKKQEKAGLPTISMNTFKNNAEKSSSRLKGVHENKVNTIAHEVDQLREGLPGMNKMKMDLDNAALQHGKILITATDLNFKYNARCLWKQDLNFQIVCGERIVINGLNGSGKTTLLKIILGELQPVSGTIYRADMKAVYIDQDYSLIDNTLNVYEQCGKFNYNALQEHEIKIRLNRFLFTKMDWDKPCKVLSGGEKMRLMLCCLTISTQSPDMIVLDEPTNNLDLQNIEILTNAVNEYRGTIIVISHDTYFVKQINVERTIDLE